MCSEEEVPGEEVPEGDDLLQCEGIAASGALPAAAATATAVVAEPTVQAAVSVSPDVDTSAASRAVPDAHATVLASADPRAAPAGDTGIIVFGGVGSVVDVGAAPPAADAAAVAPQSDVIAPPAADAPVSVGSRRSATTEEAPLGDISGAPPAGEPDMSSEEMPVAAEGAGD